MTKELKIKVCGMLFLDNREKVEKLPVDFLGFIFYPKSKRYVGKDTDRRLFDSAKNKVGVFVDESYDEILFLAQRNGFKFVQLHGKECPSVCMVLKKNGLKVIKAFNLSEDFRFEILKDYANVADYFLFDTQSRVPGGSGKKFNWDILKKYKESTPFFLSGGIKPDDASMIKQISHSHLYGIDLNSGFEDKPGLKNVDKLKKFIDELQAVW
jgi:phosphoribosylanthranilate isomerase